MGVKSNGQGWVVAKARKIIVEQLMVDEQELTNEASFIDDLGADSLDVLEMIMALEDEFGINVPDDEAEKLTTVGKAIEYIKALIAQKETV